MKNIIKLYDTRNTRMEDNLWDAYGRDIPMGGFRPFVQSQEGVVSMNQDGDVTFESEIAMMMFVLRWS